MSGVKGKAARALVPLVLALTLVYGCSGGRSTVRSHAEAAAAEASGAGMEAYERGDFHLALARFTESLRMNRGRDNRPGEVVDLVNIGRTETMLGEYGEAVSALEEAVALARALGDERGLSEAYLTLAKARSLSGQPGYALKDLDEAISIRTRLKLATGAALNLKGLFHMESGRFDEAGEALVKALAAGRKEGDGLEEANSLRALAQLSSMGYYSRPAMDLYSSAYELDRIHGDSRKVAIDLVGMAGLRFKEKNLEEAAFLYHRAYIVSRNGGLTSIAIESLERLIETYSAMGETKKVKRFTEIKEGIISGKDMDKDLKPGKGGMR